MPHWPPALITKWLQMKTVSTDDLVQELLSWIDWFKSGQSERCPECGHLRDVRPVKEATDA